ncbi:MAG: pyridoxine 5'-phosphate synthase [Nitrospinota bacterium]
MAVRSRSNFNDYDIKLGVNVDHVATVREARKVSYPSPLEVALLAMDAGADHITVHLREDRRHINDNDLVQIRKSLNGRLNLELSTNHEITQIGLKIKPWQVTFVPEKRAELTTEGGLNLLRHKKKLKDLISVFNDEDILTTLFIDPDIDSVKLSKELGATTVEINTGSYAVADNIKDQNVELKKIVDTVKSALDVGIDCNAGHGLTLDNVGRIAGLGGLKELNIGHAIIARAVVVGIESAVKEMLEAIKSSRR